VLLAGPGTGKTFVLVRRIQYLIEVEGVSPRDIAAITFTRAAAAEMRHRLEERLGAAGSRVRTSTLHSFALRELLRKGARQLPTPLRVAGDWEERWVVVEELARLLGRQVRDMTNRRGTGALDRLADDWDTLRADGAGWEDGHPDAQFLATWRRHRAVYGYTLRSELVYQLLVELRSNPRFEPPRIAVIVVDEYQDLNRCELDTVSSLAARAEAEVFAAGDDDQSVYLFRNAVPVGIRAFVDEYSGADRLVLSECMRCGQDVVNLANWLISQEVGREPKQLRSVTPWPASIHLLRFPGQATEAAAVARMVTAEIEAGNPAEEILVLAKSDASNRIAGAIQKTLAEAEIKLYMPRGSGGVSDQVNALLEYLNLAKGLRDERIDDLALRSLLELEDNRIGGDRLWAVTSLALDRSLRFSDAIAEIETNPEEFRRSRLGDIVRERDRILENAQAMTQREDETLIEWVGRVAATLGLDADSRGLLDTLAHQIEAELADETTADATETHGTLGVAPSSDPRQRDFLAELLAAMTRLGETLPTHLPDHVTFTTMHGAKGLSADIVFVLQIEEEMIPGDATGIQLDEARRLLYVSLTRARKKLVIGACQQRTGPQRFAGSKEVVNRSLSSFVRDYGLVAETVGDYLSHI
jgi:DNA helicase-2/ATP-dependent DNA helicase PcrA